MEFLDTAVYTEKKRNGSYAQTLYAMLRFCFVLSFIITFFLFYFFPTHIIKFEGMMHQVQQQILN
ncbi:MAG: hypothetical protein ACOC4B_02725, partial [Bacteroidota bacterium]